MNYRAAIEELETILDALRSQEIGVDELETKVARATELIGWCRSRLRSVEATTKQLDSNELF